VPRRRRARLVPRTTRCIFGSTPPTHVLAAWGPAGGGGDVPEVRGEYALVETYVLAQSLRETGGLKLCLGVRGLDSIWVGITRYLTVCGYALA